MMTHSKVNIGLAVIGIPKIHFNVENMILLEESVMYLTTPPPNVVGAEMWKDFSLSGRNSRTSSHLYCHEIKRHTNLEDETSALEIKENEKSRRSRFC
jgi:hypothetical protein